MAALFHSSPSTCHDLVRQVLRLDSLEPYRDVRIVDNRKGKGKNVLGIVEWCFEKRVASARISGLFKERGRPRRKTTARATNAKVGDARRRRSSGDANSGRKVAMALAEYDVRRLLSGGLSAGGLKRWGGEGEDMRSRDWGESSLGNHGERQPSTVKRRGSNRGNQTSGHGGDSDGATMLGVLTNSSHGSMAESIDDGYENPNTPPTNATTAQTILDRVASGEADLHGLQDEIKRGKVNLGKVEMRTRAAEERLAGLISQIKAKEGRVAEVKSTIQVRQQVLNKLNLAFREQILDLKEVDITREVQERLSGAKARNDTRRIVRMAVAMATVFQEGENERSEGERKGDGDKDGDRDRDIDGFGSEWRDENQNEEGRKQQRKRKRATAVSLKPLCNALAQALQKREVVEDAIGGEFVYADKSAMEFEQWETELEIIDRENMGLSNKGS
ncbi:hypothetical protein BKA65DRAFT_479941 [Rhexocercosporidium sp. MPI-PUGE-AT-0058]|nr:hypothetical protein BKA65DRAFT_479941 [Rhexocercosporidium sp. MPI-PUGE-AT-0058]